MRYYDYILLQEQNCWYVRVYISKKLVKVVISFFLSLQMICKTTNYIAYTIIIINQK